MVDDALTARLRQALADHDDLTEKRMFGGVCFMLRDHMLCGTGKPGFMFRVGREQEATALGRAGASLVVFNGRRMHGFVWVDPTYCSPRQLKSWVVLAERYIDTLPAKAPRKQPSASLPT